MQEKKDICIGESDAQFAPTGLIVLSLGAGLHGEALLQSLLVDSQHRRQGIGRRLVRRAEKAAKEAGVSSVHAVTDPENEPAKALFASMGYKLMLLWSKGL